MYGAVLGDSGGVPRLLLGGQDAVLVERFAGGTVRQGVAEREECGAGPVSVWGIQNPGGMHAGDVAQQHDSPTRAEYEIGLSKEGTDDSHVTCQDLGKRVADAGRRAPAGLDRGHEVGRSCRVERRVRSEDQMLLCILAETLPVGDVEDEREAVRQRPVKRLVLSLRPACLRGPSSVRPDFRRRLEYTGERHGIRLLTAGATHRKMDTVSEGRE